VLSFSFNKLNWQKWLLVKFGVNRLPDIHIVDRYFKTLSLFDVQNDNQGLDFFIEPVNENVITTLPDPLQSGYIGIVIGAKHATKQLPIEKMIELCLLVNHPVILLGGPEDKLIGEKIVEAVGNSIFNACGNYSLQQSASLVKNARVIISNDTGLMHIAAAFKKPVLSIWGNTIPQFGMYPYLPGSESCIFEVKNLKCRPCSKLGYPLCPKEHFNCMNKQDIAEIALKANRIFNI
jgi:ADP-heptose:LPS heptosyltransferase